MSSLTGPYTVTCYWLFLSVLSRSVLSLLILAAPWLHGWHRESACLLLPFLGGRNAQTSQSSCLLLEMKVLKTLVNSFDCWHRILLIFHFGRVCRSWKNWIYSYCCYFGCIFHFGRMCWSCKNFGHCWLAHDQTGLTSHCHFGRVCTSPLECLFQFQSCW